MSPSSKAEIPRIDVSALDPTTEAKNPEWESARSKVVEALETYGAFEAIDDRVGPELRRDLFEKAIPELFALPLEVKMKNSCPGVPFAGYIGQIPGREYESLWVAGAASLQGAQTFTNILWPQGNPTFCSTVWNYAKRMQELAQMVHRMVLESYGGGLEKYYGLHMKPESHGLRLIEYGGPDIAEIDLSLRSHKDPNMFTIITQHLVEGLEMKTKDGEWIPVPPLPNSFTFMTGEAFTVWTNGRIQAPLHRVRMTEGKKRNSVLYSTLPSDDHLVQPPEELVDKDHPLLFKPFYYKDYQNFYSSELGRKCENTLEAFCGVRSDRDGVEA